jgi:hypothetical protein
MNVKHLVPLGMVAIAAMVAALQLDAATPSRVVDRTFRCTPSSLAPGLREIDVLAIPVGERWTGSQQENPSPGYISLNSGGWRLGSELVAVRARPWQRFAVSGAPGVYAQASCRPARHSLPLSSKGLPGPPTRWRDNVSCSLSGRVLVRVRAVLDNPASWQRVNQTHFGAVRNVAEAKIAVRAEKTRRPLALLELDSRGETKLWTSAGCG